MPWFLQYFGPNGWRDYSALPIWNVSFFVWCFFRLILCWNHSLSEQLAPGAFCGDGNDDNTINVYHPGSQIMVKPRQLTGHWIPSLFSVVSTVFFAFRMMIKKAVSLKKPVHGTRDKRSEFKKQREFSHYRYFEWWRTIRWDSVDNPTFWWMNRKSLRIFTRINFVDQGQFQWNPNRG